MLKGAIFDLDGTILDSMSIWDTVGEEYLRSLGIVPTENLAETFKTFTMEESAEYYRKNYGVTLSINDIIKGINDFIGDFYRNTVQLKDGALQFLEKMSQDGVRMCIATVSDRYLTEAALERLSVRKYFSEIFTTADVGYGKNEPQIYRIAHEHLGTPKSQTIVFEDTYHALMTAKNDGFFVAAVYDAHESKQTEIKENSDYYIIDFTTAVI